MAEEMSRPANFITQIIDDDLKNHRCEKVATRFPPEPNGYLHIGHAKSICLNFGIARDYNGTCNLRFDDTNPAKEDIEYVESIKRDVNWLGFNWNGDIKYSSDYFDKLYGYALELINKGLAFVDNSSPDEIAKMRGSFTVPGTNSPYRDRTVEENLALFEKMKNGEYKEGEACLRAKIDMSSPFMCMRDPVIYRIKFAEHHQTGNKWCIYPMYDFTHCISDALEGITHSICTLEFQDNRRLYDWVLDHITIDAHPHQYEFSRLQLEHSITSKRKLHLLVSEGYVDGWDDPRMTTISGLRRRGYTPASIREFCKRIGVSKQDNNIEFSALEACIREDLNENAMRRMAVLHPLKVVIENYPEGQVEELDGVNHPLKPELGSRLLPFSREIFIEKDDFREEANKKFKRLVLGKEVRLRYSYIIKAESCDKDENGEVTCVYCTYIPGSIGADVPDHKPKGVIHWVDAKDNADVEIRLYKNLFNVANPSEAEDFLSTINKDSLEIIEHAKVEKALADAPIGSSYQFERTGYFCVDSKLSTDTKKVFNLTVALKEDAAKASV